MSTIPLRIDASLVNVARQTAALIDRTPTARIEFWAKLGRVIEACLSHDSVKSLQRIARVPDIDSLPAAVDSPGGKARAQAEIASHHVPVYSADPTMVGMILETKPYGRERRGRFVHRKFVALAKVRRR